MKKMFKPFLWLFFVLILGVLVYISPYRYLIKGIRLTYLQGTTSAHFTDWVDFDTRIIHNGSKITSLPKYKGNSVALSDTLQNMLNETESGSYLVFRNDTLVHESYLNGFTDTHHLNSFSMAKTMSTLMIQKAIELGYIHSWDDPVCRFG